MIKTAKSFSQRIMHCFVLLLALSLLYGCGAVRQGNSPSSQAYSIVITPATAQIRAGDTQLFVAMAGSARPVSPGTSTGPRSRSVAGIMRPENADVTWLVNGVPGGNAAVGTINAAGLYTAPAILPNSNYVNVAATYAAEPSVSAVARVTLYNPIPIADSVSPNTVSVGNFRLAINGRRFANGAQVLFGSTVLRTSFISTDQLTATGTAPQRQVGPVQITVRNPNPGSATAAGLSIRVISAATASPSSVPTPLSIAVNSLPGGTVYSPYSATLRASGGTPPYTWTIPSGRLPAGLTLSSSGVVSGTPSASGTFTFSLQAEDSATSPQAATQSESINVASAPSASVLWSADMETGDLTQWVNGGDGLIDQHGTGTAFVSTDFAHTGTYSAALTLRRDGDNAEMHRFAEPENPAYFAGGLYYGAWFYFPTQFVTTKSESNGNFYNIFQFLTTSWTPQFSCAYKSPGNQFNTNHTVPWNISLQNRDPQSNTPLYATLVWGAGSTPMTGPYQNSDQNIKIYKSLQANLNLPIARWTHFQVYLKQWPHDVTPYQGRIMVWQDGVLIFDLGGPNDPNGGITTKPGSDLDGTNNCTGVDVPSWNAYSDGVDAYPSPIYLDDVVISQGPVYVPE